jgi:hypothetical protein
MLTFLIGIGHTEVLRGVCFFCFFVFLFFCVFIAIGRHHGVAGTSEDPLAQTVRQTRGMRFLPIRARVEGHSLQFCAVLSPNS